MKLPERDRERLHNAKSKPITISWPSTGPDPHKGRRYPVFGKEAEKLFTIRVEGVTKLKRPPYETKALVRMDNDPIRVLPGLSGQRREDGDYEDEPERVHEDYEALLCSEAVQRNAVLQAERTQVSRREEREASVASSSRSQRAKERRIRGLGSVA